MLTFIISVLLTFPACLCSEEMASCPPGEEDVTNLWRVNTQPPSYFFGTIHVPYTLVWDGIAENAKGRLNLILPRNLWTSPFSGRPLIE